MNKNYKSYKSFSLPGGGVLRIQKEKIVATISSPDKTSIEIYCADTAVPFHITTNKHTPQEIIDYVWDIHDTDGGI